MCVHKSSRQDFTQLLISFLLHRVEVVGVLLLYFTTSVHAKCDARSFCPSTILSVCPSVGMYSMLGDGKKKASVVAALVLLLLLLPLLLVSVVWRDSGSGARRGKIVWSYVAGSGGEKYILLVSAAFGEECAFPVLRSCCYLRLGM